MCHTINVIIDFWKQPVNVHNPKSIFGNVHLLHKFNKLTVDTNI